MKRHSLYFSAPGVIEVREENLDNPAPDQVIVKAIMSAVNSGTEMLVYRGLLPGETGPELSVVPQGNFFEYPTKFGFAIIGEVFDLGKNIDSSWLGKKVFSFHPHEDFFAARLEELYILPEEMSIENGIFLPAMETAVNFLMDSRPIIGEVVAVFGQGIIGLLTTSLLAKVPISMLVAFDRYPLRQAEALKCGAEACFDPSEPDVINDTRAFLTYQGYNDGVDLALEVSGNPEGLNLAVATCGYNGRVVVGSFYGMRKATLNLGGVFQQSRIRIASSHVESISAELTARWTRDRRLQVAWKKLAEVNPAKWITNYFPFERAEEAYHVLDQAPQETIQVVLQYN